MKNNMSNPNRVLQLSVEPTGQKVECGWFEFTLQEKYLFAFLSVGI